MISPEQVNPKKFTVEEVLFNDQEFSVVLGTWNESGDHAIAMRWNGDPSDEESKGFPNQGGNPTWFIVHRSVAKATLSGLLPSAPAEQYPRIVTALNKLSPA